MSRRPRRILVGVTYLRLLRHYAAKVDAELARVESLLDPDSEAGRRHDWLTAYLDLRLSVEMLDIVLWGLVNHPRIRSEDVVPWSSASAADPSSASSAD